MDDRIVLKNVRISFPNLFTKPVFDGTEGKYGATLLIDKDDEKTYKKLKAAIKAIQAENKIKVASGNLCLTDGDESDRDEYAGYWVFKASSSKRPTVMNRDKTPITEDDEIIFAGCYVNASVGLWTQNNKWGKRVNANLYGVQFFKDGEPFGDVYDASEDFDDIDDMDDGDDGDEL
tara:strand:+ start:160 stop:687 length:528 start_codon:yes stop_codon:yes gene_type:complete